jgi:hypothetical protein
MTTNSNANNAPERPRESKPDRTSFWLAKLPEMRLHATRSQTERLMTFDHDTNELVTAQALLTPYSPQWYSVFEQLAKLDQKRANICYRIYLKQQRLAHRY